MTNIHGEFLHIVGDLQIKAEEAGLRPYSGLEERAQTDYLGYEIDETEGNAPNTDEIFGYVMLHLIIKRAGQKIRRTIELRSVNSFSTSEMDNKYVYNILEEEFDGLIQSNLR